jgi:hypothetical protein
MRQRCEIVYQNMQNFSSKEYAVECFQEKINALLLEGYQPVGGFCFANGYLCQLMTIEEKEI